MHAARTRVAAFTVLLAAGCLAAHCVPPAEAAIYTVTLKNGTTFDTRYQPEQASWDENKVVVLTEFGNLVALAGEDIDSVTIDSESRGFGHQLNASTMILGWAPNDALDMNSEEGKSYMAAEAAAAAAAASAPPVYNTQQFVEPGTMTGLPMWVTDYNSVLQVQPQVAPPAGSAPPPPQP